MIRALVTLCMLLSCIPLSVHAADEKGLFSIRGAGLLTCATYVQEREKRSDAYDMIGGWLDGYITGVNELSASTFDVSPYATTELLALLINRHCENNADDILFSVTNTLLARLYEDRLQQASDLVYVRVGTDQTRLYRAIVQEIQVQLVARGLLETKSEGAWDGEWNLATQSALAEFQKSAGLRNSGFPDQTTLWNLFRSA